MVQQLAHSENYNCSALNEVKWPYSVTSGVKKAYKSITTTEASKQGFRRMILEDFYMQYQPLLDVFVLTSESQHIPCLFRSNYPYNHVKSW